MSDCALISADVDRLLSRADQLVRDWKDAAEWNEIRPLLVQAPALLAVCQTALGVMSGMRDQIEQMRGMFPDEDGTIQAACGDHDEVEAEANRLMVLVGLARVADPAWELVREALDAWGSAFADPQRQLVAADLVEWMAHWLHKARQRLSPAARLQVSTGPL